MWRTVKVLFWIVIVALVIGPLLANSLYLDRNGIVVPAEVTAKNERISRARRSFSFLRSFEVSVTYQPLDEPWEHIATIPVDAATYDLLRVGSPVRVRYHPEGWGRFLPFGVRLEHQTTRTLLSTLDYVSLLPAGLLIILAVLVLLLRRTRAMPLRVALGSMVAVFGVALMLSTIGSDLLAERGGPRVTATATVQNVAHITTRPSSRRRRISSNELLRPFDRVQLAVDPRGDGGVVIAVDDIDAGSLPGLQEGMVLPVTYPPDEPRAARIVGATRSHRFMNWLSFPLALATLAMIVAAGWLIRSLFRTLIRRP